MTTRAKTQRSRSRDRRGRGRDVLLALVSVAAFAATAVPAWGQAVLGRTVAAATDAPVGGVFVTLTDATGRQAAGFLSRENGRFLIQAPGPGRYLLRAELIGYGSVERAVELTADETVHETVRLPLEAIPLEGIVARSSRERVCALSPTEGDALTRL